MKGNLTELGEGHWRLRVFVGRDDTGRIKQVSRNFKGSKRQADSALAKLIADIERRQVATKHVGSLGDLLDRWLEATASDRSVYTVHEYTRMINRNIKPDLGEIKLDRLTAQHIDAFYGKLRGRGLSAGSVRRHHALLHAALEQAVRWELLSKNPSDRATQPRAISCAISTPTDEQVLSLIAEAERNDHALAAAIVLASITGARRGELAALRWSDIDLSGRSLQIRRSLTAIRREWSDGSTKTRQTRKLSLDDSLAAYLAKRHAEQEAYAQLVGTRLVKDAFILSPVADGSAPYMPDRLTDNFRNLAKRAGLRTHLHQLRHYSASVAIASGSDVRTVAGRLGHAQASTTLNIYAHVIEARDQQLASLLGRTVLGVAGFAQTEPVANC
ncbi:MAG: tyrosine-type recombinase/integrase [Acidimicrobiales bacterium]